MEWLWEKCVQGDMFIEAKYKWKAFTVPAEGDVASAIAEAAVGGDVMGVLRSIAGGANVK